MSVLIVGLQDAQVGTPPPQLSAEECDSVLNAEHQHMWQGLHDCQIPLYHEGQLCFTAVEAFLMDSGWPSFFCKPLHYDPA